MLCVLLFFLSTSMLYFAEANIIIKGGNYDQKTIQKQSYADTGRAAKAHLGHDLVQRPACQSCFRGQRGLRAYPAYPHRYQNTGNQKEQNAVCHQQALLAQHHHGCTR